MKATRGEFPRSFPVCINMFTALSGCVPNYMKKAKILATLGPASRDAAGIESLIRAGADGVRINMSHGTQDEKTEDIKQARAAAKRLNRPLAVLVDLSGPKIRTRQLKDGKPVTLKAGDLFVLTTQDIIGDEKRVATNYPDLAHVVEPGTRLLLDDGAIALVVESTTETDVVCRVINGGVLGERKGINLPGVSLPIDSLTEKDIADLEVGGRAKRRLHRVVFCSSRRRLFPRKRSYQRSMADAPRWSPRLKKPKRLIIWTRLSPAADAVMVARGDLGVETSVELVPVYQKRIIEKAVAGRQDGDHGDADASVDGQQARDRRAPKHQTWRMPFGMEQTR